MRQVLLAGEKSQECAALLGNMIADGAAQHGVAPFQSIEDRALCHRALDVQLHFIANLRQVAQMIRKYYPDHGSVCTSTESTAGRSCTMTFQLSPPSACAETWSPADPNAMSSYVK